MHFWEIMWTPSDRYFFVWKRSSVNREENSSVFTPKNGSKWKQCNVYEAEMLNIFNFHHFQWWDFFCLKAKHWFRAAEFRLPTPVQLLLHDEILMLHCKDLRHHNLKILCFLLFISIKIVIVLLWRSIVGLCVNLMGLFSVRFALPRFGSSTLNCASGMHTWNL